MFKVSFLSAELGLCRMSVWEEGRKEISCGSDGQFYREETGNTGQASLQMASICANKGEPPIGVPDTFSHGICRPIAQWKATRPTTRKLERSSLAVPTAGGHDRASVSMHLAAPPTRMMAPAEAGRSEV